MPDIRYEHAARATAEICNLHLGSKEPRHVIFSKIVYLILEVMVEAEAELRDRGSPSLN